MSTFDNAWYDDLSRTHGTNEAIVRVWQFKKVLGLKTRSTRSRILQRHDNSIFSDKGIFISTHRQWRMGFD